MRVELQSFEDKYRAADDPWAFASDWYEQRKYAVTIASLPLARYARCFEPGSSIGALTERLAGVADHVVAWDASPSAIATARRRLGDVTHVEMECATIPERWPARDVRPRRAVRDRLLLGRTRARDGIVERARESLDAGGHLVAVHWLGESEDHILHGSVVHGVLRDVLGSALVRHEESGFVLEIWEGP